MNSSYTIVWAIVFGGILVAGAVYFSLRPPVIPRGATNPTLVRPIGAEDHILGNPAARVLIIEYTDFDCTFCKDFHEILRQIIANEGTNGEVAWVLREFPLTEIHPNAFSHARAAECAASVAGNDAFWKFTDALFKHQPVHPSTYGTIAASAGISGNAFATCVADAPSAIETRITADRQNALAMGVSGTPYSLIFVKGKSPVVIDGAYAYEAVKQLIDQALAQ